jgi:hypothetical protein
MFKKIYAQVQDYKTTLTKQEFLSDPVKIQKEIDKLQKEFTPDRLIAVNTTFENKKYTLDQFLRHLKQQKSDIEDKRSVQKEYDTFLFHNIGGKNVDVSTEEGQNQIKRELAAIEKQIQIQEETLAQIDNYVVSLLSGEIANLNIAHTNAKFIKIAKDDMEKNADEVIENYYNELYEDSEGSPDFGTVLEHPKETRNELTTKIHHHRFKKK